MKKENQFLNLTTINQFSSLGTKLIDRHQTQGLNGFIIGKHRIKLTGTKVKIKYWTNVNFRY